MSDAIVVDAGPVVAVHRLALAVQAIDANTGAPVAETLRVTRETVRAPAGGPGFLDHGGGRYVLSHARDVSAEAMVRIADPGRRFVPRRLVVQLWPLPTVVGFDQRPPTATFVPARSRLVRPWMLPGHDRATGPGDAGRGARPMGQGGGVLGGRPHRLGARRRAWRGGRRR